MAPSKDYWIRRAEELEKRAAEQGETLIRQALRHYKRAAQEISSQIEEFYGRYASEQGLSYAEAVKVLRGSEAKAWTKTLGAYVDEINALPDGALKDRLKAELDARAYSSRITRLDALKAQVDMEVDRLMIDLEDGMGEGFGDLYTDSYYRKMFDIQQHAGKMFDFAHLNRELVEQTLSYPWSGADFSSRLWENKRALLFHLREIMTQGAIQGKGVAALSKELSDKLGQTVSAPPGFPARTPDSGAGDWPRWGADPDERPAHLPSSGCRSRGCGKPPPAGGESGRKTPWKNKPART